MFGFDLIASEGVDRAAKILRLCAFFADVLALARRQAGEETVEIRIVAVVPVKLLTFAAH